MMWNFLAGALLSDVVPVLYDGHATHPDPGVLWKLVEESEAAVFGASPAYIRLMRRAGYKPREHFALASLEDAVARRLPGERGMHGLVHREHQAGSVGRGRAAVAPRCARASWAAFRHCRCAPARFRRARWAAPRTRSTVAASAS